MKMKGCVNLDKKMTDIYLPRKCDYTDRIVPSKDHSSIMLSICDVPLHLLSSTKMAPLTSENPTSSPFQDSYAHQAWETLPYKKSSMKKESHDLYPLPYTWHPTYLTDCTCLSPISPHPPHIIHYIVPTNHINISKSK